MKHTVLDKRWNFITVFDDVTGVYVRSGVIENGKDTGVDPFMASFPHLIDVGIMGHCRHGKTGLCARAGIGCYQRGMSVEGPNMTLADFSEIVRQCAGRVNQFALGGRGDPDLHEHFGEIVKLCRDHHIAPNFTTSGYGLTEDSVALCKQFCGAVAVSWYRSDYTQRAVQLLLDAGVKTNIHYVLSGSTIGEAVERLRRGDFPKGINAVLFLLHKPIGQGKHDDVLRMDHPLLPRFFELLDKQRLPFKIGLDSCTTPGVINFCTNVMLASIDTCEGGRFSCYIDAAMNMLPCSFDQSMEYAVSLRQHTIAQAWESGEFERFRDKLRLACPGCKERVACLGGCPLLGDIVLCERDDRSVTPMKGRTT